MQATWSIRSKISGSSKSFVVSLTTVTELRLASQEYVNINRNFEASLSVLCVISTLQLINFLFLHFTLKWGTTDQTILPGVLADLLLLFKLILHC